jgi:chorismate synthase
MASNRFGKIFTITTWGESHGKAIGVVIDGCPAGLYVDNEIINEALLLRAPGLHAYTSPRKEADRAELLSGVFEGVTTGAPISIIIYNHDADSSKYEPIKEALRPGHANFTYLEKYGVFDYRGGGRSSARETACRVAAGAVAEKLLEREGIQTLAYLSQIGTTHAAVNPTLEPSEMRQLVLSNPLFCPDPVAVQEMMQLIEKAKAEGDSLGGVVSFIANPISTGLGDPVYEKLEANLAQAMLSIPATKGFEIGLGFQAVTMQGSAHNDSFILKDQKVQTATNYAGGTLGGISTGMPIHGRVAFKPTSSIMKPQETVSREGKEMKFSLPEGSRHDPCVAIRAVPVVEAMLILVLADAILMNKVARI